MHTCFLLTGIDNPCSNLVSVSPATNSISAYLSQLIKKEFNVVVINYGPLSKTAGRRYSKRYETSGIEIAEFNPGATFLPGRFRFKLMLQQVLAYLRTNFKEGDKLLVYHSLGLLGIYEQLLQICGSKNSVLLVAELYSFVDGYQPFEKKELEAIALFSKYIPMSKGIYEAITNKKNKSSCFVYLYGNYDASLYDGSLMPNRSKVPVHVVYAGNSSATKGGLYNAIASAKFLPNDFILHVYSNVPGELKSMVEKTPNIVNEGTVSENKLNSALVTYDIGLAVQNPDKQFNLASFPSKICKYMSCGLNVVSSKSKSVLESPFNEYVTFYDEDGSGRSLASAIISSSKNIDYLKNVSLIKNLDGDFKTKLFNILDASI